MSLDDLSQNIYGCIILADFDKADITHQVKTGKLRKILMESGYTEAEVSSCLSISNLQSYSSHRNIIIDKYVLGTSILDQLIRLFLLNIPLRRDVIEKDLGNDVFDFLLEIGILSYTGDGDIISLISIFPYGNLFIVTDAWEYASVWSDSPRYDDRVMYLGHDSTGLSYIASETTVKDTLDLCCGSGFQSLIASRYSQKVTGVDINKRAIRMAEFNSVLNNINNIIFLQGDLYDPVANMTFDAILANPPFVPNIEAPSGPLLFRDGGIRGENILSRIISRSMDHLNHDGRLTIVSDFVNLHDYPRKLSSWQNENIETHIFIEEETPLVEYAINHTAFIDNKCDAQNYVCKILNAFEEASIETIHFGYLVQKPAEEGMFGVSYLNGPVIKPNQIVIHDLMKTNLVKKQKGSEDIERISLKINPEVEISLLMLNDEQSIRVRSANALIGKDCNISLSVFSVLEKIHKGQDKIEVFEESEKNTIWELIDLDILFFR